MPTRKIYKSNGLYIPLQPKGKERVINGVYSAFLGNKILV